MKLQLQIIHKPHILYTPSRTAHDRSDLAITILISQIMGEKAAVLDAAQLRLDPKILGLRQA